MSVCSSVYKNECVPSAWGKNVKLVKKTLTFYNLFHIKSLEGEVCRIKFLALTVCTQRSQWCPFSIENCPSFTKFLTLKDCALYSQEFYTKILKRFSNR